MIPILFAVFVVAAAPGVLVFLITRGLVAVFGVKRAVFAAVPIFGTIAVALLALIAISLYPAAPTTQQGEEQIIANAGDMEESVATDLRRPTTAEADYPLSREIVDAWQQVGAESGWMKMNKSGDLMFYSSAARLVDADPEFDVLPAFRIRDLKRGPLPKLPDPGSPFGLVVRFQHVTDDLMKTLVSVSSLQALDLSTTSVTDAGLAELAKLDDLRMLDLSQTDVTVEGMKKLAVLENLCLLNLGVTEIPEPEWKGLEEMLPKCRLVGFFRKLPNGVGPVRSLAFNPDGGRLLVAGTSGKVEQGGVAVLWDTTSGKQVATFEILEYGGSVLSVAISPDGSKVLTGSSNSSAALWNVATAERLQIVTGHTKPVTSVAFSENGQRMMTASDDTTAIIWDVGTGDRLVTLEGHGDGIVSAAFNSKGSKVVTGSKDSTAKVWDALNGEAIANLDGHTGTVTSVSFSPDGTHMLTGSQDSTIILWDLVTGTRRLTLDPGPVLTVRFSHDGHQVLAATVQEGIAHARSWNMTGDEIYCHPCALDTIFEECNSAFTMILPGYPTVVCDTNKGGRFERPPRSVLTEEDFVAPWEGHDVYGDEVRSGREDPTSQLVDIGSAPRKRRESRERHVWECINRPCFCVAFSPNGMMIAIGSADMTAIVWDTDYAAYRDEHDNAQ
jgi:WD40 repeat protein